MNHDYDSIARFYDWAAGWTLSPVRRAVAQMALRSGAEKILDIGCGTGLQLLELKRQGLTAVGVDNSEAMLGVARGRLGGDDEAALVLSSGSGLPFGDDAFDLAIMMLLLHESADEPFGLLDEALRLAPCLYILDWGMPERNLDCPVHSAVRFVERLAGSRHYTSYKAYLRQGALEGLMLRYSRERRVRVAWRKQMFFNSILMMQLERA